MEPVEIFTVIVIVSLSGLLCSLFFKKGLGLIGNIIVGILGCIFGSWLFFEVLDVKKNFLFTGDWKWLNTVLVGAVGAIIILAVINLVFKKKK